MKNFFIMVCFIFIPMLTLETLLHINFFYMEIVKYSYPTEWFYGFASPPDKWPNVIIMGSSWARNSIDPIQLSSLLNSQTSKVSVGDIAVPSDSLSDDYFTLYRILKTCAVCPNKVVLVVTDISLKSHLLQAWNGVSQARIKQNFIDDTTSNAVLKKAAGIDPAYKTFYDELELEKNVRLYFMSQQIRTSFQRAVFNRFNITNIHGGVLVKTQISEDPGYGYYPYNIRLGDLSPKDSINNYRSYLGKYKIGGSGEFFLRSFLTLAAKQKIKVYIVLPPLTDYYQKDFGNYVSQYRNFIIQIGRETHNPVLNAIQFDSNDHSIYTDANHLNMYGATLFTPYVAQFIKKMQNY